jgi:hypothetical protein
MEKEEKTEVQKIVEKQGMFISRMPDWAKDIIKSRANEEFCGDYGMCIAQFVREGNELNTIKEKFFSGELAKLVEDKHSSNDQEYIKMGNGDKIKLKGGNKK